VKFKIQIVLLIVFQLIFSVAFSQKNVVSLFNGQNLNGWSIIDKPAKVKVKNRAINLRMTSGTARHAFVRTNNKYKNFIFEVDFKCDIGLNSGIMLRCVDAPDTSFSALYGYMVKVDPKVDRKWTGGLMIDYGNGYEWPQTLENNEPARNAEKPGWNSLKVQAIGNHISVWLNEIPTINIISDKYKKGCFDFKIHF